MKIRYIVILFTLVMIGTFLFTEKYIEENNFGLVNIVELNDRYKNIEKEINNQKQINKIEQKYKCQIAMLTDKDYQAVIYNSIQNNKIIMDHYKDKKIVGKIIFSGQHDIYIREIWNLKIKIAFIFMTILLIGYIFIYIIYRQVMKPFYNLKKFATNISRGNLDIPLKITANNYFGAFTESFDILREELKSAKEGEFKANQSKKELVASLSHDIKTPVSTIKAICEILMIKIKDKEILEKIKVIDQKSTMIDSLINNMFHATLEELEVLKINKTEEFSTIIPKMFEEINHYGKIKIKNDIPQCIIYADKLRLNQVIDNIINNSYKYAETDIEVSFYNKEDEQNRGIEIIIRDSGKGVNEDEIPLIEQKYYRGKNAEGKSGSGLGLYLAKLFMEGMDGEMEIYNDNGFVVDLFLKRV